MGATDREGVRRRGTLAAVTRLGRGAMGSLQVVAGLAALTIVVASVADIGSRSLRGSSVAGVVELCSVLLPIVAFLAMGPAEREQAHPRTSLVTSRLPKPVVRVVHLVGGTLTTLLTAWMAYLTAQLAAEAVSEREALFGLVRMPVWPAKVAIPVGLAVFCAVSLRQVLDTARGRVQRPSTDDDVAAAAGGGAV